MVLYVYLNENCLPFLPHDAATERDREEARRRRLAGEAVPPPRHGGQMLQCAVLKALAFDPQERYQSAEAFREALEACAQQAAEADPEPVPEPKPEEERAAGKRKIPRWLVGLAAAVVLVVAVCVSHIYHEENVRWALEKDAVLQSFAADAEEDGLTVAAVEMDADNRVVEIRLDDADGKEKRAVIDYAESGRINLIREYDAFWNQTKETRYRSDGTISFVAEYDQRMTMQTAYYEDSTIRSWNIHEYDLSGNRIKWTYCNGDGTICFTCEYNTSGSETRRTYYNSDGTVNRVEES